LTIRHLNQTELARRWRMSGRTLEGWRWLGKGPPYVKAGGKVLYRLQEIEAFETGQLRLRTPRRRKCRVMTITATDDQGA
jgi:hypothetical protein